ncbi:MAG: helix-turn-helix domain-containing protein [Candidatus Thermoplasmatota archaeon]|jgi:predicted DNA binding protein|nr:helix-turn-helix domain-containing protein [Candidatus Thermoplasmatota archaeon]
MFFKAMIDHSDCWSQVLSGYDNITGELMFQNVREDSIDATVLFKCIQRGEKKVFQSFFEELKNHSRILSFKSTTSLDHGYCRVVRLEASRDVSFSDLLLRSDTYTIKEFFIKGYELWYWFVGTSNMNYFLEQVKPRTKSIRIKNLGNSLSLEQFTWLNEPMTPSQEEILGELFYNGYFEKSQRPGLRDISKKMNISKSSLARKYRNAIGTLVSNHVAKIKKMDELLQLDL